MADKNVNIRVSTTGAGKAKEQLGGLNGAISKMGKVVGLASAAYFGARGLINGFQFAIEAASKQEDAEKKLAFALGRTSKALLDQASALQKVTRFGDEATIAQQAFLASMGFTEKQIIDIIPVAMDLASATGMELESAIRNTAKTFSGMAGELGELVPQLRELTAAEMKAGEAVKVMAELFSGQARSSAETMSGKIEQMHNTIGDTAETLAEVFGPAIIGTTELIGKLATKIDEGIAWTGDFIMNLFDIEKATEAVVTDTTDYAAKQEQLRKETEKLNKELDRQKTHQELLVKFYRDRSDAIGSEINALLMEQEALSGVDGVMLEVIKHGGEVTEFELGQLERLVQLKKVVEELRAVQEEKNFQESLGFTNFEDAHLKQIEMTKAEEENRKKFLELYPEEAKSLGLIHSEKEKLIIQDLKSAALQQGSAKDAMKAVVRAEAMEAVAGYISSVFKTVPYPFNLIAAATGGAVVSGLMDKALASFATGGDFITSGPQMIMVGDNPGGQERVRVDPISSPNINGSGNGMTINIQGGLIDESYVNNELIPALNKATSLGTKLNA